jgi:putative hydrolase of the HAD superfamily
MARSISGSIECPPDQNNSWNSPYPDRDKYPSSPRLFSVNLDLREEDNDQNQISVVLFDMDNTLFDLVGAQLRACGEVAGYLGCGDADEIFSYFLRPVRGFESHENIRDFMAERGIYSASRLLEACNVYDTVKLASVSLYPGVGETLLFLSQSGIRTGLVTDAESHEAQRRLEKTGIAAYFNPVITFDKCGEKKPSPLPFVMALDALGAVSAGVLFVGDSPRRDIEPCRKLGMQTAYARFGDRFSASRDPVMADYTIDRMDELVRIVSGMLQGPTFPQ